jgi:hypothetical protein
MKSLFRLLLVVAFSILGFAQRGPTLVTKDNWQALHSRVKLEPQAAKSSDLVLQDALQNRVQIGIFYAIMWPDGQAQYEFDWVKSVGPLGCPPECTWYGSNTLEFSSMTVNANGTSSTYGPFNESGYLGIAWFPDTTQSETLSTCQPLTQIGPTSNNTAYRTSCIDVALQLIFPTNPCTFTRINGESFTTRKINTSFIVPLVGRTELMAHCDDGGVFCGGQTIPIYVQRVALQH